MACQIADNQPLTNLRNDLKLKPQCHSLREGCLHNYIKSSGNHAMAAPGAVIGYCQALFRKQSDPELHTNFVTEQLRKINAPWLLSHELFWSHHNELNAPTFFDKGFKPLLGEGRVPVVISSLDPAKDYDEIVKILSSEPSVYPGETVLLRVALSGIASVEKVSTLLINIIDRCFADNEMPKWWLLLQGKLDITEWDKLKNNLGDYWKYVNIAVNPYITETLPDYCWKQVTVAQVVVGHADGISEDGTIKLAAGMKIQGAANQASYNLDEYAKVLSKLDEVPTLIILGPALAHWSDEENIQRISKLLPHLKVVCNKLWDFISDDKKENVWKLTA